MRSNLTTYLAACLTVILFEAAVNASRTKTRRLQSKLSGPKRYTCYVCNSTSNAGCGAEFNASAVETQLCVPGAVCSLAVTSINGDSINTDRPLGNIKYPFYRRGCSPVIEMGRIDGCEKPPKYTTDELPFRDEYCVCNRHFCNVEPPSRPLDRQLPSVIAFLHVFCWTSSTIDNWLISL